MAETKKKRVLLKVGDVFEIPLFDGKHAYGQYYSLDRGGPIIKVFNLRTKDRIDPKEVTTYELMFPPIYVGILSPFRDGPPEKLWKKVGNIPISDYVPPIFRSAITISPGKYGKWYIIQGEKTEEVGLKLPKKYRTLEKKAVWPADLVVERIENGGILPDKLKWLADY